nr:chemotaxis protein CheB [Rhodococcus sp. (in: high G+C Gram-positive bacteria)]
MSSSRGIDSRVIVVGGSAGGLDALSAMLGAAEPGLGWCFVVAQHMAPAGSSGLVSILSRVCALEVVEASDKDLLAPDTVFIAPPGRDIVLDTERIRIETPDIEQRPWPSIDRLFVSAATTFGENSIAVVLSGTGNDGASGVEAIESAGGVVVVQDLSTATFESMPSAAFATGSVDIQAPAADIPGELARFLGTVLPPSASAATTEHADIFEAVPLGDVIGVLHEEAGVDFSGYKTSTLQRQISRRLRLLGLTEIDAYVTYIRETPNEAAALARALLVTVTAFFRDKNVWDGLRGYLDAAIADSDNDQFRVWVPGCASGEEAYTVAMLVADALGISHDDLSGRMKIFATDLDERALDHARTGRFSASEADAIPPRLRQTWTRPVTDGIEILPALREAIVFARHNVAFDPPFPNLDLVSLRNTLIYFQPRLQERVLQLCQFALVPNGLLLLGQSERVPRDDEMFVVVDNEHRLYRRRQHSRLLGLPLGRMIATVKPSRRAEPFDIRSRNSTADGRFYRDIVKAVAPSALILDDRSVLIEVIGDVGQWCIVSEGAHSGNVVDLLKDEYRSAVRAMLSQLRHSSPRMATRSIRTIDGVTQISVTRIESAVDGAGGGSTAGAVVTFDSGPTVDDSVPVDTGRGDADAAQVSAELESVYEALQSTVEDLSSSNEELQALNEELQASSEELQASSEEVQASNEELEATNEELTTLNQELGVRGTELTRANVDLENIQSSLTNGLVLLDLELRVTRYTALAVRLFSLIQSDVGRELAAVPTTIPVPDLADALQTTLAGESRIIELESDDRDLLVQTQPYRGERNDILGAIVVVIDVSEITAERRSRERALANLEMVTESIKATVWQRTSSGDISLLTRRVEDLYGLERPRVIADPSLLVSAVHPEDRDRVASISASAEDSWEMRYRIIRPDGTIRWIDESATLMHPLDGSSPVRVGSAVDVTEQQRLSDEIRAQSTLLSTLFDSDSLGILLVDGQGRIVRASAAIADMTGFPSGSLVGRELRSLLSPISSDGTATENSNWLLTKADGRGVPIAVEQLTDGSHHDGTVMVVHDSTRLRRLSAELAAFEQFDQQTGLLTRSFFRSSAIELVESVQNNVAVLWIDLDGFKEVNDRLGHRSGDLVLGVIATRLKRAVRKNHLVGRLGGDEFAVLVNAIDDLDALDNLVHRILSSIREPVVIDDTQAFVSASIGVAVQPQDGTTAEELLHNADVAMYSAKQAGRDQHIYFTAEMDRDADARAAMRHQLAAAVRHRDFELHYQPIRHADTGEIAMIEALIRWRRDGELVTAGQFIDLAADTGQLRALGHIVLDCLIADVETLYEAIGPDHPQVAVNMSASELRERDLMDRLLSWHPAAGFEKIVIEVTEHVTLVPGDRAFEALALLRRLGATISIDDFGTGYSNLELLGQLKPGIIKIDRSLTESAAVDERGSRILDAAVGLAHALETIPVIEGVGSAELSAVAARTGAELVQGYYLGRPMPLGRIIDSLTERV